MAKGDTLWGNFLQAAKICRGKFHIQRSDIFFEIFAAFGARNRDDVFTLGKQPCKSQLPRCALLFLCEQFDPSDEVEVLLKIFPLKAWRHAAVIIGGEIIKFLDLSRKESAPKWAVSHKGDTQIRAWWELLRPRDRGFRVSIRFAMRQ